MCEWWVSVELKRSLCILTSLWLDWRPAWKPESITVKHFLSSQYCFELTSHSWIIRDFPEYLCSVNQYYTYIYHKKELNVWFLTLFHDLKTLFARIFHHWRGQSIIIGYQAINSNSLEQTATREHQSGVRKYTFAILFRELWKNDSAHG